MEHWWEVAVSVVFVVAASLVFDFAAIPDGIGKLGAFFSAAFLPSLAIQYKKVADSELKVKTGPFVVYMILNTGMVLFFATIILLAIGKL